jgi:hypothetical protein
MRRLRWPAELAEPKSYGYEKCFLHSDKLSFHGRAFAGKERLVVALHVPKALALPGDAVAVTVPIAVRRAKRVVRVGVYGHETPLTPQVQGARTEVQVPMADSSPRRQAGQAAGKTRACYVGFDLSE